jgi:hypothetical protein
VDGRCCAATRACCIRGSPTYSPDTGVSASSWSQVELIKVASTCITREKDSIVS